MYRRKMPRCSFVKFKGIEKLREKLPGYPGRRLALIPLLALLVCIVGLAFMLSMDTVSRIFADVAILADIEPVLPVLGAFISMSTGILCIRRVWTKREQAMAELGDLAYQRMLVTGLAGVFLILSVILHAFVSVRSLPPGPPVNELTSFLSTSIFSLLGVPYALDLAVRIVAGSVFTILAAMTAARAVLTFGIDYMTVVYLYFPEESELQENEIYSVVRHPAYFGIILFGVGAILFRLSVYSVLFALIIAIGLLVHLRVEEGELIERFGDSYSEYMRNVPGLRVKPRDFGTYLRFLAGRTSTSAS
ncbi:MAG: methyltransferase family protein [Candidatus Thorarchaeota archaeon]